MPSSGKITLSPKQAEAYQSLLALDPTGKKREFSVEAITGKLEAYLYLALKRQGLLIRPKKKKGERGPNVTTVVRRPYSVKGDDGHSTKKPAAGAKTGQKRRSATDTGKAASSPKQDNELAGHHEFFLQHHAVLAEADQRRARL